MEICHTTSDDITIVKLAGDIDGKTVPETWRKLLLLVRADCKIVLDMSQVSYMSSAGLRMLLSLHRQVAGSGGKTALVGLSADIRDTMSATGFLRYFVVVENITKAWRP